MNEHNSEHGEFANIAENPLRELGERKREERGLRRAAAVNAVTMARSHAGRHEEPYSQSDADTIMAITELLDRVAGL